MANETFTLNSLETGSPAMSDFFLKSDSNVNYRKCSLSQIATAIIANSFSVTDVDLSSYVDSKFTASRARMKKIGNFAVWFSIQVTVSEAFSSQYGEHVVTFGGDIAPAPTYTAELSCYNVTKGQAVRAYKSGASISVIGSYDSGDVLVIGGSYIC